jgi:hypothetical protein
LTFLNKFKITGKDEKYSGDVIMGRGVDGTVT